MRLRRWNSNLGFSVLSVFRGHPFKVGIFLWGLYRALEHASSAVFCREPALYSSHLSQPYFPESLNLRHLASSFKPALLMFWLALRVSLTQYEQISPCFQSSHVGFPCRSL